MTAMRGAPGLFVVVLVGACARHPTSTPELVAALTGAGVHVEARAERQPSADLPGAELEVELVLDYEEVYRAERYPSADLARTGCQSGPRSIQIGSWCLDPAASPPRVETWKKVATLETQKMLRE
jgi:hypothetical protein